MYTILLVDDSTDVRTMLKDLVLKHFGDVEIIEASDGEGAYKAVNEQLPDLVFMDVGLPGVNGLELTKQIKKQHKDLSIIIFSNYDYPEYKNEAFRNGADFYLSKTESTENEIIRIIRNKKTPTVRH